MNVGAKIREKDRILNRRRRNDELCNGFIYSQFLLAVFRLAIKEENSS
jgi:hypothetical protein